MASVGHFMVEKEKNFEKELLLFWTVLVILISVPINKYEGQWLESREEFLLTNDTLSQYELICLHVHLLRSWSPTIKAVRLQIKSYRLLLISLYFKEYISLTTDPKASDGLELNWCCHYDHACRCVQKQNTNTNNNNEIK